MNRWVGICGVVWGTVGVFAMLLFAVYRLVPRAIDTIDAGLSSGQWVLAGAFCVFMAYTEGYRGFHTRFSPRTAARLRYLKDRPDLLRSLLAPLFAVGFFHATRRTQVTAYLLTTAIVLIVVVVQRLGQPWRGIIDAGVVIGLTWGVASLGLWIRRVFAGSGDRVSPEVPG